MPLSSDFRFFRWKSRRVAGGKTLESRADAFERSTGASGTRDGELAQSAGVAVQIDNTLARQISVETRHDAATEAQRVESCARISSPASGSAMLAEHIASLSCPARVTLPRTATRRLAACSTESRARAPVLRALSLVPHARVLFSYAHQAEPGEFGMLHHANASDLRTPPWIPDVAELEPGIGAMSFGDTEFALQRRELQQNDDAPIQRNTPRIARDKNPIAPRTTAIPRAPPRIAQHHRCQQQKRVSVLSGITRAEGQIDAVKGGETQDSLDDPTLTEEHDTMARRKAAVAGAPSEIPFAVLTEARARVLRWVRSKKMDYDTAQDIASEVVAHLWERAKDDPRLITSPAARDKFVIGSAKHARLVHLRRELRRQERQAVFEIESRERNHLWMSPAEEVGYLQLADAVKEVLDGMSAGRRDAFLLVHDSECDYETVAAILDISIEAAESRVCMVRKVLRTFLAKYREEGEVKAVKKENKENKEKKERRNAA